MKLPYLVKTSKLNPPANPCRIFSPSISEAPQINHMTVPMQKSIRFFIIMLPAFFALVKPASHMANPACIQNTSAAPARNHTAKTSPSNAFIISSVITISFLLQAYLCTGASLCRRSLFTSIPLRRRSYAIKKASHQTFCHAFVECPFQVQFISCSAFPEIYLIKQKSVTEEFRDAFVF